jgi:hypothetical protein
MHPVRGVIVVDQILRPLLFEQARLEAELKQNPVFKRLEAVRAAIASLRIAYDQPRDLTINFHINPGKKNPVSITGRVVSLAESAMRANNKRYKSTEILAMALKEGVEIDSPKPQSVVASILSHEKRFSNGFDEYGAGYGPVEWMLLNKDEAPSALALEPQESLPSGDQTGAD